MHWATQAVFVRVGGFVPDTPVSPHCRSCFVNKLDFLEVPLAPDTGNADDGESGSGESSSGGSSETNCSNSSTELVGDEVGIMRPPNPVDVPSDDDMPLLRCVSRRV